MLTNCWSLVNTATFHSSRFMLTVSYAAVRSTKMALVTRPPSYPSSICCAKLRTWSQHDFPGGSQLDLMTGSLCVSSSLYVWQSREIRWKLLGSFGVFPGLSRATTFAFLHFCFFFCFPWRRCYKAVAAIATGPKVFSCSTVIHTSSFIRF